MGAGVRTIVAVLALTSALAACGDGRVLIDFDPQPGATYHYEVTVRSETLTEIEGNAPARVVDEVHLDVEHTVLSVSSSGSRVRLSLRGGGVDQNLVVRLDRGAQLTAVDRIEGFAPDLLGDLGLSAVFPAAVGAPPRRRLAPGDRWEIDQAVAVPGAPPARVVGTGRLAELGVVGGRDVASVATKVTVAVDRSVRESRGRVEMRGQQVTTATTARALGDGAVEAATSRTVGRYRLTLLPDAGAGTTAIPGALTVEVEARTRRVD